MFLCAQKRRFGRYIKGGCALLAVVLLLTAGGAALWRGVESSTHEKTPHGEGIPSADPYGPVISLTAGDLDFGGALPPSLSPIPAEAAVLMEASTGAVICGRNPHARLPMASTTKIMTALVALESLPPETVVTVPAEAVGVEGSSVYLCEGETLTLEELLYALLLESANDAAVAIALAVAGSVEEFASLMNTRSAELGLSDTHFVNPHGLDAEGHYTTAYELALITRAALENPTLAAICATRKRVIPLGGEEGARLLLNHNRLLADYEGCIGVKTGYTKATGRCLVSAARRDGVTLIAVTLGCPDDWRTHTALLDHGFSLCQSVTLCEPGFYSAPLWVVSGAAEYVMAENTDLLSLTLPRGHGAIVCRVEVPRFVFAPLSAGEAVGRLVFSETLPDGSLRELGTVPLHAAYGVEEVRYRRKFPLTEWLHSRGGASIKMQKIFH